MICPRYGPLSPSPAFAPRCCPLRRRSGQPRTLLADVTVVRLCRLLCPQRNVQLASGTPTALWRATPGSMCPCAGNRPLQPQTPAAQVRCPVAARVPGASALPDLLLGTRAPMPSAPYGDVAPPFLPRTTSLGPLPAQCGGLGSLGSAGPTLCRAPPRSRPPSGSTCAALPSGAHLPVP